MHKKVLVIGDYKVMNIFETRFEGKSFEGPLPRYSVFSKKTHYLGAVNVSNLLERLGVRNSVLVFRKQDTNEENSIYICPSRIPTDDIYICENNIIFHATQNKLFRPLLSREEFVNKVREIMEKFDIIVAVDRGEGFFKVLGEVPRNVNFATLDKYHYMFEGKVDIARIGGSHLLRIFGIKEYHLRNMTSLINFSLRLYKEINSSVIVSYRNIGLSVIDKQNMMLYYLPLGLKRMYKIGVGDLFFAGIIKSYLSNNNLLESCLKALDVAQRYLISGEIIWKEKIEEWVENVKKIKL